MMERKRKKWWSKGKWQVGHGGEKEEEEDNLNEEDTVKWGSIIYWKAMGIMF